MLTETTQKTYLMQVELRINEQTVVTVTYIAERCGNVIATQHLRLVHPSLSLMAAFELVKKFMRDRAK